MQGHLAKCTDCKLLRVALLAFASAVTAALFLLHSTALQPAYAAISASNDSDLAIYDTSWYSSDKDKFTLKTAEELAGLARLVDDKGITFKGKTISLGSDIDLSSVCGKDIGRTWLPIGWTNTTAGGESVPAKWSFQGTFDGKGHTISGLYVNQNISSIIGATGLFGSTHNAVLKDFTVSGKSIAISGGTAAGVAGVSTGTTFEDITSDVDVTVGEDDKSAAGYAGGITAYVFDDEGKDATFKHLINKGDVTGDCKYIGGIAGYLHMQRGTAKVYACVNEGKISGASSNYVSDTYTGGIIGSTGNSNGSGDYVIEGCSNSGDVSGSGDATGGIAGRMMGHESTSLSFCYNTGDISSSEKTGGIIGLLTNSNATVSNSYSSGEISGSASTKGGIIGALGASIDSENLTNNYSKRGTAKAYSNNAVSKGANNSGTSKSENELKRKSFLKTINNGARDKDIEFVYSEEGPRNSWQIYGFTRTSEEDADEDSGGKSGDDSEDKNGDADDAGKDAGQDSDESKNDGGGANTNPDGDNDNEQTTDNKPSDQPAVDDNKPSDNPVVDDTEPADNPAAGDDADSDKPTADDTEHAADDVESIDEPVSDNSEPDNRPAVDDSELIDEATIDDAKPDDKPAVNDDKPVDQSTTDNVEPADKQASAGVSPKTNESKTQEPDEQAEEKSSPHFVEVEVAAVKSALEQSDDQGIDIASSAMSLVSLVVLVLSGFMLETIAFRRKQPASTS